MWFCSGCDVYKREIDKMNVTPDDRNNKKREKKIKFLSENRYLKSLFFSHKYLHMKKEENFFSSHFISFFLSNWEVDEEICLFFFNNFHNELFFTLIIFFFLYFYIRFFFSACAHGFIDIHGQLKRVDIHWHYTLNVL